MINKLGLISYYYFQMRDAGKNTMETKAELFGREAARKVEGARIDLAEPDMMTYANAAMDLGVLENETGAPESREPFMKLMEAA